MPRQSASGKQVRFSADELPARTPRDMARLKAAMDLPVEPSEEREASRFVGPEVRRDPSGRIAKRPLGQLRAAILAALDHHQMTRYELWKKAHARCDSLSASAVYEYLRGDREIGSEYMEALLEAARLKVVDQGRSRAEKPAAVPPIEETINIGTPELIDQAGRANTSGPQMPMRRVGQSHQTTAHKTAARRTTVRKTAASKPRKLKGPEVPKSNKTVKK